MYCDVVTYQILNILVHFITKLLLVLLLLLISNHHHKFLSVILLVPPVRLLNTRSSSANHMTATHYLNVMKTNKVLTARLNRKKRKFSDFESGWLQKCINSTCSRVSLKSAQWFMGYFANRQITYKRPAVSEIQL